MDWDKVVKDAVGETARKREAESEGAAIKARQLDVRFAEIEKTMRATVLPVFESASSSLRKNGYRAEIQPDRGPEGSLLLGLTLRIWSSRASRSRKAEAPSSAFELKAEPEGRTLHFSTVYPPQFDGPGASEDLPHMQITPQWLEERLKVFVERALGGN